MSNRLGQGSVEVLGLNHFQFYNSFTFTFVLYLFVSNCAISCHFVHALFKFFVSKLLNLKLLLYVAKFSARKYDNLNIFQECFKEIKHILIKHKYH